MTTLTPEPSALTWLDGRDRIPTIVWADATVVDGFSPDDAYVETYWLPLLGPSATWALRRITGWLAKSAESGLWLPLEPFARSLGLGSSSARNSAVRRTIGRLVDFHLARIDPDRDVLAVRTVIPRLSERSVDRLPGHLAAQHRTDHPIKVDGPQRRDREDLSPTAERADGRTRLPHPGPTAGLGTTHPTLDSQGALR